MIFSQETYQPLHAQWLSSEDKQMTSTSSTSVWLISHSTIVLALQLCIVSFYIFVTFWKLLLYIFSRKFGNVMRSLHETTGWSRHLQVPEQMSSTALIMRQMALIFTYLLLAFTLKWFRFVVQDSPITSMDVYRWLLEASLMPLTLCDYLLSHYISLDDEVICETQSCFVMEISIRVPLFILMRFAESKSNFFVNVFEAHLVDSLCKFRVEKLLFSE